MRDALTFMRTVMETETFSSACAIRVPVFPRELSSNFSSHSFRQKPKEPEWDWRLRAVLWRRTVGSSGARIVTMGAPVLLFACLKQKRTNQGRPSFWRGKDQLPRRKDDSRNRAPEPKHLAISLADGVRIEDGMYCAAVTTIST